MDWERHDGVKKLLLREEDNFGSTVLGGCALEVDEAASARWALRREFAERVAPLCRQICSRSSLSRAVDHYPCSAAASEIADAKGKGRQTTATPRQRALTVCQRALTPRQMASRLCQIVSMRRQMASTLRQMASAPRQITMTARRILDRAVN
jgi:hypothetical protein